MTTPTREDNRIRVIREIPLTWVIGGATSFLIAIGSVAWVQITGQQRLTELMTLQGAAIQELTAKVAQLSAQINGKDLKDVEHDIRLNDLGRRVADNEVALRQMQAAVVRNGKQP